LENLDLQRLEAHIKDVAQRLFSDKNVDELETWHLVQVIEHCSRAISDIYRTVNLDQILRGTLYRARGLDEFLPADSTADPLRRISRVPDKLRGIGDRCLYDIGMAGVKDYRGLSLETLGVRSYRMAADILSILANERDLRELFQRNLLRSLPIEEEIAFLRQCATRFTLHARLLSTLREESPSENTEDPSPPRPGPESSGMQGGTETRRISKPADTGASGSSVSFSQPGEARDRVLSRYERILLFADTDIEAIRSELKAMVIDQDDAVDALCDDLLLNATGTQTKGVPQTYFLVGPTGVGKNYLMECLAKVLESHWRVQIPFLIIEGPQYTYPSDVNELRGATRGFIRSDEPGILTEFHDLSSRAPLSIILVDEIEKAHPQLSKFFLSIMDRGSIHDNRGNELSFEGTLLAFTSNLGYSVSDLPIEPIGYRSTSPSAHPRAGEAERHLRRALSPEFLARLKTIRFSPLSLQSMESILEIEVEKIFDRFLHLHGLKVSLTGAARKRLLEMGFSSGHGARHLASVIRRYCNIEVSRRIRQDQSSSNEDRVVTLQQLREIRKGERAFDAQHMERMVFQQARASLPYAGMVIDFCEGEFRYLEHGP
jgi:hypothetical protein